MAKHRECRECGKAFAASRSTAVFCTAPCRKAFNNRRMVRGAEVYDLVMAWRFERDRADKLDIRGLLGRVASGYRTADTALRSGRQSWDLDEALSRLPIAYSINIGDGR